VIIRKATASEIITCFHKYATMDDWLPVTTKPAREFAKAVIKSNYFMRVAEDNGEVVAFLYAEPEEILHMSFPVYKQKYYCSWCPGIKAAKAVKLLHNALFDFAEARGYWMVMSTGSHFDEEHRFTKLLERFGWERRGYIAMRKTRSYSPELAATGIFQKPRPSGLASRKIAHG